MNIYSQYNDLFVIELIKKGDELAFEALYDRYWDKLLAVGGNKLHNISQVEDIIQDIFLDVWNRRENILIKESVSGYFVGFPVLVQVKTKLFFFTSQRIL